MLVNAFLSPHVVVFTLLTETVPSTLGHCGKV